MPLGSMLHRSLLVVYRRGGNRSLSAAIISSDLRDYTSLYNLGDWRCQHHIKQLQQSRALSMHHSHQQPLQSLSRLSAGNSISSRRRRCLVSQPISQQTEVNNNAHAQPTLFSLPNLLHPSDFIQLANNAIRECDSVRRTLAASLSSANDNNTASATVDSTTNTIAASKVQRAKQTLHRLDDISNIVCTVIDAAELCRSVHASPQWRRGASDAFGILSEYIGNLNADERLYQSLSKFVFFADDNESTTTILSQLPPEYQRMAMAMKREFERDGIHLQYTQREEARELNNVIVGLESLFNNNITEKTKYYEVEGTSMVNEVDRIVPRHVLGQLVRNQPGDNAANQHGNDKEKSSLMLSSDNLLTNTLLAHSPSSSLRKEVYMQSHTSIPENLNVLDSLIRHRHLHSTLLGYKSYAHRVLSDRMVGSPDKVHEFLSSMEERSSRVFKRDMEQMLVAKKYIEGDNSNIEPWDVPFYTTLIKAQRQHQRLKEDGANSNDGSSSSGGDVDDEDISSQFHGYFTVENSIEGKDTNK